MFKPFDVEEQSEIVAGLISEGEQFISTWKEDHSLDSFPGSIDGLLNRLRAYMNLYRIEYRDRIDPSEL